MKRCLILSAVITVLALGGAFSTALADPATMRAHADPTWVTNSLITNDVVEKYRVAAVLSSGYIQTDTLTRQWAQTDPNGENYVLGEGRSIFVQAMGYARTDDAKYKTAAVNCTTGCWPTIRTSPTAGTIGGSIPTGPSRPPTTTRTPSATARCSTAWPARTASPAT